jgi:hypothetical protein
MGCDMAEGRTWVWERVSDWGDWRSGGSSMRGRVWRLRVFGVTRVTPIEDRGYSTYNRYRRSLTRDDHVRESKIFRLESVMEHNKYDSG